MTPRRALLFIAVAVACALGPRAHAAVIIVPDDQPTIRAAVNAAVAATPCRFAPGTHAESVLVANTPPFTTPADVTAAGNTASGNTLADVRVDP